MAGILPSGALHSAQKPRMLVVCFDGTTNEYGPENTNVVKFFAMLRKDSEDEQLCYYQTGIGTYEPPSFWSPLTKWLAKLADEAVAWYLNAHVMGGYDFLCPLSTSIYRRWHWNTPEGRLEFCTALIKSQRVPKPLDLVVVGRKRKISAYDAAGTGHSLPRNR